MTSPINRKPASGRKERSGIALGLGLGSNALATLSIITSLASLFSHFVCCGWVVAIPMAIIGLIVGVAGLIVPLAMGRRGIVIPITGAVLSFLAVVVSIGMISYGSYLVRQGIDEATKRPTWAQQQNWPDPQPRPRSSRTQTNPDQPKPKPRQAPEKTYEEVYGKDARQAQAGDGLAKLNFARRLSQGAQDVAGDDPPLARLLREKAAGFAVAHSDGYPLAHDMLAELTKDKNARNRTELLEQQAAVLEKMLRSNPAEPQVLTEELVDTCRELIGAHTRAHQLGAAQKVLDRAKGAIATYLPDAKQLTEEMDWRAKALTLERRGLVPAQAAEKKLKEAPADPAANTTLGLYRLAFDNDKMAAAPLLAKSADPACQNLAKVLDKNRPADLELAAACKAAGEAPVAGEAKSRMLALAVRHYRAALAAAPDGPDASKIKLELSRLPAPEEINQTPWYAKIAAAVKNNTVVETKMVGNGDNPAKDMPGTGAVLVGFEVGLGDFVGNTIVKNVRPIYQTFQGRTDGEMLGGQHDKTVRIEAKPGYAVASIRMQTGLGIDGFSVTFMEVQGTSLNPAKSYESEWVGGKAGLPGGSIVSSDNALIVGVSSQSRGKMGRHKFLSGLAWLTLPAEGK